MQVGTRRAVKFDEDRLMQTVIEEKPQREDGDDDESESYSVDDEENPLISQEHVTIIQAAIPKYTM